MREQNAQLSLAKEGHPCSTDQEEKTRYSVGYMQKHVHKMLHEGATSVCGMWNASTIYCTPKEALKINTLVKAGVGSQISIKWDATDTWYTATITDYDPKTQQHEIEYTGEDSCEWLVLADHEHRMIQPSNVNPEEVEDQPHQPVTLHCAGRPVQSQLAGGRKVPSSELPPPTPSSPLLPNKMTILHRASGVTPSVPTERSPRGNKRKHGSLNTVAPQIPVTLHFAGQFGRPFAGAGQHDSSHTLHSVYNGTTSARVQPDPKTPLEPNRKSQPEKGVPTRRVSSRQAEKQTKQGQEELKLDGKRRNPPKVFTAVSSKLAVLLDDGDVNEHASNGNRSYSSLLCSTPNCTLLTNHLGNHSGSQGEEPVQTRFSSSAAGPSIASNRRPLGKRYLRSGGAGTVTSNTGVNPTQRTRSTRAQSNGTPNRRFEPSSPGAAVAKLARPTSTLDGGDFSRSVYKCGCGKDFTSRMGLCGHRITCKDRTRLVAKLARPIAAAAAAAAAADDDAEDSGSGQGGAGSAGMHAHASVTEGTIKLARPISSPLRKASTSSIYKCGCGKTYLTGHALGGHLGKCNDPKKKYIGPLAIAAKAVPVDESTIEIDGLLFVESQIQTDAGNEGTDDDGDDGNGDGDGEDEDEDEDEDAITVSSKSKGAAAVEETQKSNTTLSKQRAGKKHAYQSKLSAGQMCVGLLIEAKDSTMWYPSTIKAVDTHKKEILVHYNGWSNRHDVWFPFDTPDCRVANEDAPASSRRSRQSDQRKEGHARDAVKVVEVRSVDSIKLTNATTQKVKHFGTPAEARQYLDIPKTTFYRRLKDGKSVKGWIVGDAADRDDASHTRATTSPAQKTATPELLKTPVHAVEPAEGQKVRAYNKPHKLTRKVDGATETIYFLSSAEAKLHVGITSDRLGEKAWYDGIKKRMPIEGWSVSRCSSAEALRRTPGTIAHGNTVLAPRKKPRGMLRTGDHHDNSMDLIDIAADSTAVGKAEAPATLSSRESARERSIKNLEKGREAMRANREKKKKLLLELHNSKGRALQPAVRPIEDGGAVEPPMQRSWGGRSGRFAAPVKRFVACSCGSTTRCACNSIGSNGADGWAGTKSSSHGWSDAPDTENDDAELDSSAQVGYARGTRVKALWRGKQYPATIIDREFAYDVEYDDGTIEYKKPVSTVKPMTDGKTGKHVPKRKLARSGELHMALKKAKIDGAENEASFNTQLAESELRFKQKVAAVEDAFNAKLAERQESFQQHVAKNASFKQRTEEETAATQIFSGRQTSAIDRLKALALQAGVDASLVDEAAKVK